MDGKVGAAVDQCVFEFLGENSLQAELFERRGGEAVARGLDDEDFGGHAAGAIEGFAHVIRLPERECAATSCYANGLHSRSLSGRASSAGSLRSSRTSRPKRWRTASMAARRPRICPPLRRRLVGRFEDAFDKVVCDGHVALALVRRNVFEAIDMLTQQPFALLAEATTKVVHDGGCFQGGAPAFELGDVAR